MDTDTRAQIRKILDHFDDISRHAFEQELRAIYADHAARGLIKSGATVKRALRTMEEFASRLITDVIDSAVAVSKEAEAFAMISDTIHAHLSYLGDQVEDIAEKAGGRRTVAGLRDAILKAADDRFSDARRRLERQLELHRFTFTQPIQAGFTSTISIPAPDAASLAQKNRGGKPLAAHWDAMWAAIAAKLYAGDLKPHSQADIECAMKDWFADHDREAGDTSIRGRARALWTAIQNAD